MLHKLHDLMEQKVDVVAVDTIYTGILREITETTVSLWTEHGWLSIPHERIDEVRPARPAPSLARTKTKKAP